MPNVMQAATPRQAANTRFFNIGSGTQRAGGVCLSPQEQDGRGDRDRKRSDAANRQPAPARPFDHCEREPAERGDGQCLPRQVELAALRVLGFRYRCPCQRKRRHAERNDQQEDAAPSDRVDQRAADCRADDEGETVAARPQAERVGALFGVRIGDSEDRERGRHFQRRTESGNGAAGDQHDGVRRQAAYQRADGEQRDAEREDAAAAVKIGKRAGGQKQARVDQIIGCQPPIAARSRRRRAWRRFA